MLKSLCIIMHLCTTLSGEAIVLDGDTIIVEGIHVRLQGLDAEELKEPHGLEAKQYMQEIVHGATITCQLTGERSYSRFIGRCYYGIVDIATLMVSAGKALDCGRYSKGQYRPYEPPNIRSKLMQKPYC